MFASLQKFIFMPLIRWRGTITHVHTKKPCIALTFDDGPSPEYTGRLADILEKHGAQGTFFIVGTRGAQYPELIQRLIENGHAVCNHSWDHASFPMLTRQQRLTQLRRCQAILPPGQAKFFRPPFGHQNRSSALDILLAGYQSVTWNVLAQDWLDHNTRYIVDRVGTKLTPGDIVLFHDSLYTYLEERYRNMESTLEAVDILLGKYPQYQYITVPELCRQGKPQRVDWLKWPDMAWMNRLHSTQRNH